VGPAVGRPGGSAAAEYHRRRAVERGAWLRTLPWRIAVALGAGVLVGLAAGALLERQVAVLAGLLAAAALGWTLRFQASPATRA
jgi:hypothetical protein